MTTVTFATFCHPPHLERLHKPGVLADILMSHRQHFDQVIVVHQRCHGLPYEPIGMPFVSVYESEDYHPGILSKFGIPEEDPIADELTHGPNAAHYWKWHVINHLIALTEATSEYIVFSDCDCRIVAAPLEPPSWVQVGINWLREDPSVFCVCPSEGSGPRKTQNMSQQLFLVETARMRREPLNLPWNGQFDAPGGPMQEYYFMLEGRIGRMLTTRGLYRHILNNRYRYWHYNPWEV
jgi:hypothetical protein